jgi:hypothetical protein
VTIKTHCNTRTALGVDPQLGDALQVALDRPRGTVQHHQRRALRLDVGAGEAAGDEDLAGAVLGVWAVAGIIGGQLVWRSRLDAQQGARVAVATLQATEVNSGRLSEPGPYQRRQGSCSSKKINSPVSLHAQAAGRDVARHEGAGAGRLQREGGAGGGGKAGANGN